MQQMYIFEKSVYERKEAKVDLQVIFPFFWFVIMAIVLALVYLSAQGKREQIEQHLASLGASDIQIRYRFFDFDKTNYTYDVTYTDRAGNHQQTTCKVRGDLWAGNTLYWSNTPDFAQALSLSSNSYQNPPHGSRQTMQTSEAVETLLHGINSKEQLYAQSDQEKDRLIAELILENARLYQENKRLMV